MKILLLEDEVGLRDTIKLFLEQKGHKIITVGDGYQAQLIAQSEKFDIFIFDINVPTITGQELLIRLNNNGNTTPAIFMTAIEDEVVIDRSFNIGIDFLSKPFKTAELNNRLKKFENAMCNTKKEEIQLTENYTYSKKNNELKYKGQTVILTLVRSRIIKLLVKNKGNLTSFELLNNTIWDGETTNENISKNVNRLKKDLKEEFIFKVHGVGFTIS